MNSAPKGAPLSEIDMQYPKNASEFEIQAELYFGLRKLGFDARGEVPTSKCRFDLVVFDNKQPVLIIECKKPAYVWRNKDVKWDARRRQEVRQQIDKYRCFGVPVHVIGSMLEAKKYLCRCRMHGKLPVAKYDPHTRNNRPKLVEVLPGIRLDSTNPAHRKMKADLSKVRGYMNSSQFRSWCYGIRTFRDLEWGLRPAKHI